VRSNRQPWLRGRSIRSLMIVPTAVALLLVGGPAHAAGPERAEPGKAAAPTPKAAAEQLVDAWVNGDRAAAREAAVSDEVVDILFAEPAPAEPQPLKCRVTSHGWVCVHEPSVARASAAETDVVSLSRFQPGLRPMAFLVNEITPGDYKVTRVIPGLGAHPTGI
jgi:hypothetical protein